MTHRLFVAIKPPEPVLDLLIDTMDGIDNARWQSDEQMHLTLRFVGEIDSPAANDLADALTQVRCEPFDLAIRGTGHFEKKGRTHTLWAGIAPSPALLALQKRVESACRSVGLPPETRSYAPHITLARLSGSAGAVGPFLTKWGDLKSPPFTVSQFILFESTLSSHGAHYDPVMSFPLRA
ncbi:RNA 2',3'-cyclic phosphodiesterase [Croceicoccus mobilis]|uniref:RNA 2',3'-cyclic phosphodiesterase n=1 Tax=Croceicoccus mobilis TaxID=1703339 RepID=A0A916YX77_9SPHN|nr:RNA 2',3'-cyclic phosphodiesterase [Croceicoccus mobilis]GGD66184.1 RNA 2',3'-cyclic phosphodiesterase [Croceicoccus mobilis]